VGTATEPRGGRTAKRVVRGAGWALIGFGVLILLYLVYLMFFTSMETEQAQRELLEEWEISFGAVDEALPAEPLDAEQAQAEADATPVDPGGAYAVMWFERPGSDERPVNADALYVVEGTSLSVLRRGPGHYTETSAPGAPGNFAISGHRTTYSAPFYHLDRAQPGDEIHVVDREGREWVYVVRRLEVVTPRSVWVLEPDPLDTGTPTMTITTCHPRWSASQRLVLFAELQGAGA
jgi:sortase A